ncbi:hypothetical protein HHI36_000130 [Cryptolaemus montrouzieri]|uniref:DDE-1 domain-containing protein n=1 Tax=Cryptolaemus montrouzieri TaxID=559131 RepID=A0ABD2P3N9_9CUCU
MEEDKIFGRNDKQVAGKWWWTESNKRHNSTLHVSENIAAYRAFEKLDSLVTRPEIKDMLDRFRKCDETDLSIVVKQTKIVTSIGKRYIYKRVYAGTGESQTLMSCICASGSWIYPLIIFNVVRWNDALKTNCLPDAQVKLSPKGWINSELFLERFQFFTMTILLCSSWIEMPHTSILR